MLGMLAIIIIMVIIINSGILGELYEIKETLYKIE